MIGGWKLPMIAGASDPDPAVFCPARGYYDPSLPIPYTPDPLIPAIIPNDGEIILYMTTQWDAAINCITTNTTTAQIRYTVYGNNDTVIFTQDVNSNIAFFYEFPASGGTLLSNGFYGFKVIIKVATTGTLGTFKMLAKSGYAPNGWPVIQAHFKAPTLTSLSEAFKDQLALGYVKFYGNHNSLVYLNSFCYGAKNLVECSMGVEMTALTLMGSAFQITSSLTKITLPVSLIALASINRAFSSSGLKAFPTFPTSLPELLDCNQAFSYCASMSGECVVPQIPKAQDIIYMFLDCKLVTKIRFTSGCKPNTGSAISTVQGCTNLVELDMLNTSTWGVAGADNWNFSYFVNGCPSLKKIIFPAAFAGLHTPINQMFLNDNYFNVTEVSTADWTNCPVIPAYLYFFNAPIFNQPTLKTNACSMNGSSVRPGKITYFEIDWINSTVINIGLIYQQLSVTEINRIFTALPTIVTVRTIDVRYNPGYATCDPTIATVKGWTVS